MALRTRVWSAGKLFLLASALVGTYVLFAAAAMRLALTSREVQVPDLTNRTANEATAEVASLGLALKVDEARRPDPARLIEAFRHSASTLNLGGALGSRSLPGQIRRLSTTIQRSRTASRARAVKM
jgi:hypothetical protein